MSISSITSANANPSVLPSAITQGVQASQVNSASDPDGDGDGGAHKTHGHGHGGQMQQALMQALQSMGLSLPQPTTGTNSTTATTGTTAVSGSSDRGGDSGGSGSRSGSIRGDMRQFMAALFQAVNGQAASATSSTGTASTASAGQSNFSAGLSSLISQVGNGSAPAALQTAFSQLSADLQASGTSTSSTSTSSTSASSTGSSTTSSAAAPQLTLQALLTQLQQNLNYGSSGMAATGNIVSTLA